MKNLISALLMVAIVLCLMESCTKTITPPLNNVSQLVIEGTVSDTTGPYHVNISKTTDFYSDNIYPAVSGATVVITDMTNQITDVLSEAASGDYITHTIIGVPGHTYEMKVMLGGKTYLASSTMPSLIRLDSVNFDYDAADNTRPVANYQDPAGIKNYYKYSLQKNGAHVKRFQTFDDRLSDGRYIHDNLDADTGTFHRGDLVRISLVSVDAAAYKFLKASEDVAYGNADLAAPSTPPSNISGGCIGYFSAQTVSSKTAVVKSGR